MPGEAVQNNQNQEIKSEVGQSGGWDALVEVPYDGAATKTEGAGATVSGAPDGEKLAAGAPAEAATAAAEAAVAMKAALAGAQEYVIGGETPETGVKVYINPEAKQAVVEMPPAESGAVSQGESSGDVVTGAAVEVATNNVVNDAEAVEAAADSAKVAETVDDAKVAEAVADGTKVAETVADSAVAEKVAVGADDGKENVGGEVVDKAEQVQSREERIGQVTEKLRKRPVFQRLLAKAMVKFSDVVKRVVTWAKEIVAEEQAEQEAAAQVEAELGAGDGAGAAEGEPSEDTEKDAENAAEAEAGETKAEDAKVESAETEESSADVAESEQDADEKQRQAELDNILRGRSPEETAKTMKRDLFTLKDEIERMGKTVYFDQESQEHQKKLIKEAWGEYRSMLRRLRMILPLTKKNQEAAQDERQETVQPEEGKSGESQEVITSAETGDNVENQKEDSSDLDDILEKYAGKRANMTVDDDVVNDILDEYLSDGKADKTKTDTDIDGILAEHPPKEQAEVTEAETKAEDGAEAKAETKAGDETETEGRSERDAETENEAEVDTQVEAKDKEDEYAALKRLRTRLHEVEIARREAERRLDEWVVLTRGQEGHESLTVLGDSLTRLRALESDLIRQIESKDSEILQQQLKDERERAKRGMEFLRRIGAV